MVQGRRSTKANATKGKRGVQWPEARWTGFSRNLLPLRLGHDRQKDISCNALGDSFCRLIERVMCQIGVTRRGLDIAVVEQLADQRKGLSEGQRTGREAVA